MILEILSPSGELLAEPPMALDDAVRLYRVVRGSAVAVAPVMPLSLSYDHRVIDGALGRRFMAMVIEHLSEPVLFLA